MSQSNRKTAMCACGCGQRKTNIRRKYAPGHPAMFSKSNASKYRIGRLLYDALIDTEPLKPVRDFPQQPIKRLVETRPLYFAEEVRKVMWRLQRKNPTITDAQALNEAKAIVKGRKKEVAACKEICIDPI